MNIEKELESLRAMFIVLQNWEKNIEYKRQAAIYGTGRRIDDVKVQTTKRPDAMEEKILEYQELEEKKADLFLAYMDKRSQVMPYIDNYITDAKYIDVIHRYYVQGLELSNIPKCTKNTLKKALQHIQNNIDLEAEIERQSPKIQGLIRGGRCKCKYCEGGYYSLDEITEERFIFVCNSCGKRYKADKKGSEADASKDNEKA